MKAAAIRRYKQPVAIVDLPKPSPGPGDLLVKMRAASVNPLDFKIRDGGVKALIRYSFPLILGNDLAGEVEAVGEGVTRFRPGDAIYARLDKHRIGAFAEYALVSEGAAAAKPKNLDWAEAASLPLVGLTAWQALIDLGGLKPAQKVLIHAGAGGVGTFAIQLAKHLGATVTTTASARNHDLVRSLGADVIVDYKTTPFDDVVRDQDMVFDTQGGDTLLRSFTCVKAGRRGGHRRRRPRRQVRPRLGAEPAHPVGAGLHDAQDHAPGQAATGALRVLAHEGLRGAARRDRQARRERSDQACCGQEISARRCPRGAGLR